MKLNKKQQFILLGVAAVVVIALIFTLIFVFIADKGEEDHEADAFYEEEVVPEPLMLYGICADDYDISESVIRKNEMLSDILSEYGVSQTTIHNVEIAAKDVYSVRKLKEGASYRVLLTKDSVPEIDYFVYDISPTDYAVYAFKDSVYCYTGVLPTDTVINRVSGTIESSLWNAMIDCGAEPVLAVKLSEVYAWTIDFFGIQPEDCFDVIYEDVYVAGDKVGVGKILTSVFENGGKTCRAYYFDDGERGDYYDENGQSLRRQFLKAPLNYTRISSGFSYARRHPITKKVRPHLGVDYAAPSGTPVQSIGDGVVVAKGWDKKGGGNYVKIKHNSVYTTLYMHLKGFAKGIAAGSRVNQGQVIGFVGSTGSSTGPHLDFRVFKNGSAINPLKMEAPPVQPVPDSLMEKYKNIVDEYDLMLTQ